MSESNAHPVVLEGTGPSGDVQFRVETGYLSVNDEAGSLSIPVDRLDRICYRLGSWRAGTCSPPIRLAVHYRRDDGRNMRKEILLSGENGKNAELLRRLEEHYPDQSFIGPNEREKEIILSDTWRGAYPLHSLPILTLLGIVTGLILVSVLVVCVILAEDMPVRAVSLQAMSEARDLLLILSLLPAVFMALILGRMRMVLRTDREGLTVRSVFGRKRISWGNVEIGKLRSDAFNVYTGLFCYYSDQVNVVSSRDLVEIPVLNSRKPETVLRLNLEEAGPLFRELYYRGKMTLESAQKAGAFLPKVPLLSSLYP